MGIGRCLGAGRAAQRDVLFDGHRGATVTMPNTPLVALGHAPDASAMERHLRRPVGVEPLAVSGGPHTGQISWLR